MDKQITDAIVKYLNNGEVFLKKEAPEVVQQAMAFYKWSILYNFITSFSALVLFSCGAIYCGYPVQSHCGTFDVACSEHQFLYSSATAVLTIFAIGSLFWVMIQVENFQKLRIAPKLFLLEEFSNIVGGD